MTTKVDGTLGVDRIKDGTVVQADLAAGVAGNGPAFAATAVAGAVPATITTITYTETLDTNNNFDPTTGRFTPTVAGWYLLTAYIVNNVNVAATVIGYIRKNGGNTCVSLCNIPAGIGGTHMSLSALVYMNGTTDYADTAIANNVAGYSVLAGNFSGCLVRAA